MSVKTHVPGRSSICGSLASLGENCIIYCPLISWYFWSLGDTTLSNLRTKRSFSIDTLGIIIKIRAWACTIWSQNMKLKHHIELSIISVSLNTRCCYLKAASICTMVEHSGWTQKVNTVDHEWPTAPTQSSLTDIALFELFVLIRRTKWTI